jgi:hypothetical protein
MKKRDKVLLGLGIFGLLVALWKILTGRRVGPYFER